MRDRTVSATVAVGLLAALFGLATDAAPGLAVVSGPVPTRSAPADADVPRLIVYHDPDDTAAQLFTGPTGTTAEDRSTAPRTPHRLTVRQVTDVDSVP